MRCLGAVPASLLIAVTGVAAQPRDDAGREAIIITDDGRLSVVPRSGLDLRELLRANRGTLDLDELRDIIARPPDQTGFVTGRVLASRWHQSGTDLVAAEDGFRDAVPLPQIEITLESRHDPEGVVFGPWRTTVAGAFVSQPLRAGRYRMCADAPGWQRHCRDLAIGAGRMHLEPFAMHPQRMRRAGTVHGRVELADGGFPFFDIPHAGLLDSARVTAFNTAGQQLRQTHVNAMGDYFLPNLPAGQPTRIVVTLESADTVLNIPPMQIPADGFLRRDITLANSRPVVTDPVARRGNREIFAARPGETVEVSMEVSDPDGDAVEVRWFPDPASGAISSDTGEVIDWTLPDGPGANVLRAVITDGRGGVRTRSLRLVTAQEGELFTGTVSATDTPALANATVEINGARTVTNANGYFTLRVPGADRYVMNIRSPGHALLSQIYRRPSQGGRYELVRATVQSADPRGEIVVHDRRRPEECRGAPSASLNWEAVDGRRLQPIRLGGEGRVHHDQPEITRVADEMLPQRRVRHPCGPGATVRIPAGGLVDAAGNPPPGNVEVAISTYDIEAAMEMPGDYTTAAPGSAEAIGFMESFGAAFVQVRDDTRIYNLAEGVQAELTIPAAGPQLAAGAALPPSIPIFHYDDERGVWNETGTAERDGDRFVTQVAHFSAINVDLEFTDPACIHVRTEPGGVMPDQLNLELTIPSAAGIGAAPTVMTGVLNAAQTNDHVLWRLPAGRDVVIVPYDPVSDIPYGTFVVNSGAPHGAATNPPPHTACENTAVLFVPDAPRVLPDGVAYLQGLFTFFAHDVTDASTYSEDLLDASQDYYAQVDPLGRRTTFGDFKQLWGFDETATNARYANSADLGFGRDMHCVTRDLTEDGSDEVACFVSNYGFREDDDQDNANWASQRLEEQYVATVAMEYAPIENPGTEAAPSFNAAVGHVVKFFVYGRDPEPAGIPDHDAGQLVIAADLDGYGTRPIPQLCMVCHGGSLPNAVNQDSAGDPTPGPLPVFGSAADVDLGARFLPFDLESFTFPSAGPVQGSQQAAFKALNLDHVARTELSGAIEELLEEYYGPTGAAAAQATEFVIDGWADSLASAAMYEHVVGPACRICHVAHDEINRTFETATELPPGLAGFYTCNARSMPHSVRTYERLWTSLNPHQPGQLANYMSDAGLSATDCTFPPNNMQSFEPPG